MLTLLPLTKQEPKSKDRSWRSEPQPPTSQGMLSPECRRLCWSSVVSSHCLHQEQGGDRASTLSGMKREMASEGLRLWQAQNTLVNMSHGSHPNLLSGFPNLHGGAGQQPLQMADLQESSPTTFPYNVLYNLFISRNCCRTQVPESPVTPCGKR